MADAVGSQVILTDKIRQWIRILLTTAKLPNDVKEEFKKHATARRPSGDQKPLTVPFGLVKQLHDFLGNEQGSLYLHELLEGSDVYLPKPELPPRNPELEARIEKLKAEAANREYVSMTKNVDIKSLKGIDGEQLSVGQEVKQMNNQLLTVINFLLTVVGAFAFGYKAMEYASETPSLPMQLLVGMVFATAVFVADLYFLIRYTIYQNNLKVTWIGASDADSTMDGDYRWPDGSEAVWNPSFVVTAKPGANTNENCVAVDGPGEWILRPCTSGTTSFVKSPPIMLTKKPTLIEDPSDKFRPEKAELEFRNFTNDCEYINRIKQTYTLMHTNQTYDFVKDRLKHWTKFNHGEHTMMEVLEALNSLIDQSDPDTDVPNIVHAFQTAERIREVHPDKDWMHLVGLIHDAGKIMSIWGEPQWCVVGDTFPTGCAPQESIVFGRENFKDNPDIEHPVYGTKLGIYEENCGLENVLMSWSHDEYMARVLEHNGHSIPEEGIYMIRYHSFYPWHTGGDYKYLMNNKDNEMMKWILEFNKFDLYSKADSLPNIRELMPYYQGLIKKYIHKEKLQW